MVVPGICAIIRLLFSFVIISSAQGTIENVGFRQGNSIDVPVPSTEQDYVELVNLPTTVHSRQFTVQYFCQTNKIVGIDLTVTADDGAVHRLYQKAWNCSRTDIVNKKYVKLKLSDSVKYRPNYFNNRHAVVINGASLRVWMLEIPTWAIAKIYRDPYARALIHNAYEINILPPYSRPAKRLDKSCPSWSWTILSVFRSRYWMTCMAQKETLEVVDYPAAMNGQAYGIIRSFLNYTEPELEAVRRKHITSSSITISMWVYILEFCEGQAPLCSFMYHFNRHNLYLSPLMLVNKDGYLHLQLTLVDGQSSAALSIFPVLRNQWIRLVFALSPLKWQLTMNYGPHLNETVTTELKLNIPILLDDVEGLFAFGGAEHMPSFRGYIGQATVYRNRFIDAKKIPLPSPYHPMFELGLSRRDERCQTYLGWVEHRIKVFQARKDKIIASRSCPDYYYEMWKKASKTVIDHFCSPEWAPRSRHFHLANKLIGKSVFSATKTVWHDLADTLYNHSITLIQEGGLEKVKNTVTFLKQASCYGNYDAMYMLAVILSNGIGLKSDEIQAHAYLMLATLNKHRLSNLAMGHRHKYGLDGIPLDEAQAFMYFKYVGDKTKEDREEHKDTDVLTESIRLTDEFQMHEQTDEDGDIFLWLKNQAQKGVLTAQQRMARTLYWGSQGLKRNLDSALEYFKMGAESQDPESIYDYGILLMKGQGTQKNMDEGMKHIKKSADMQNPMAVNALGWYTMFHDHNYTEAAKYFEHAYALHSVDGANNLGYMHLTGTYPDKEMDDDLALQYFEWAATRGQIDAGLYVASLHMKGTQKMERNLVIAVEWARFIAEQNPALGITLRSALNAYRKDNIPLSLFYYMLAANAGIEVGAFNLAILCEENKDGVVSLLEKECPWRNFNLTTLREPQFVDPYSYIKMGDYHWYGCGGEQDPDRAAAFYAQAALKDDPHAIFNLGFMLEDGATVKDDVWKTLGITEEVYKNNNTLLLELYNRCQDSHKTEAYLPCSIAFYRIQLLDVWQRYKMIIEISSFLIVGTITSASLYSLYYHLTRGSPRREHMNDL